ncbi:MAG: acetyl-CoA carboxylase biotin carboxyl carrier protein [Polyangiaceae bacterium]|nr:acetyl-CoA carboxylase biotin carboxyl carrier protein [Polyangiaceae bacterium]
MDIDIPQLKALLSALVDGGVTEFEFEDEAVRLRINRGPSKEVVVSAAPQFVGSLMPQAAASYSVDAGPASVPPMSVPAASVAAPVADDANVFFVTSPFVGTFYRQPSPDAPPFVDVGTKVREGQTLCIVEAMKLMNELEADAAGVIVDCLVENGKPVEFGQKLFKLKPA